MFLELEVQHDKVPTSILAWEGGFCYPQNSTSSWLNKKENGEKLIDTITFCRTLQLDFLAITLSYTEFSTSSR